MTVSSAPDRVRRSVGVWTTYRWELNKLAVQARVRYSLAVCLIAPVLGVVILASQQSPPKDTLFGRHIHDSGYAMPLLILGFASQWILPLLTALVAGDIFASEDHYGTWKTVLTRSAGRTQIFWAKTFAAATFALIVLTVLAAATIVGSVVVVGRQPLTGLTGQLIPPGSAAVLVAEAWASEAIPLLAFTALAIMLSVLTRNPAAGVAAPVVVGLLMELLSSLSGLGAARRLLPTTAFDAWHGFFVAHPFSSTFFTGLVVCFGWAAVTLTVSLISLRRRDITGG